MIKSILFSITLISSFYWTNAQTPGMIFEPATGASATVLDPNGDGYVSQSTTGFVTDDQLESEIPFTSLVFPGSEPTSDLNNAPNCGFTDFADQGDRDPAQKYLSPAGNWLFRLRMGGTAPNAKSYSVLIDTDGKFGNTGANADPNYTINNPGFEIEIVLATKFGVYVYDVNTPNCTPVISYTSTTDVHYQKSIAGSLNCGDLDYFYDFYVVFADLVAQFPALSLSTSTAMRYVIVDNTAAKASTICQPSSASDIGGVGNCPNLAACFTQIIDVQQPCAPGASGCTVRSDCPTINSILNSATSVSGTSTETVSTVITIYKNSNPTPIGTTTVNASGTWTLTPISPALASNDTIKATAQAPNEFVSLNTCAYVIVGSTCTQAPATATLSTISGSKGIRITLAAGTFSAGTSIYMYNPDGTLFNPIVLVAGATNPIITTTATNVYDFACQTGNCFPNATYYISYQQPGQCNSTLVPYCYGTTGTTQTPTITTNPITASTTSITGSVPAPYNVSGVSITIYVNGVLKQNVTTAAAGTWTASGLTLNPCDSIQARASFSTSCISSFSTTKYVTGGVTSAPVVLGSFCVPSGSIITTVSGTSSEANGTVIQVFENGVAEGTTVTVNNGVWTATTSISIAAGSTITAKATAPCKTISAFSNSVVVSIQSSAGTLSITTNPIVEQATSISGIGTNGSTVQVYIDGYPVGSPVAVTSGSWTVSGLASYELYTQGVITAAATVGSGCASNAVAGGTVICIPPTNTLTINPASASFCSVASGTVAVSVTNSQNLIVYQLYLADGVTPTGPSKLGNGAAITLTTGVLTSSTTLKLKAFYLPPGSCQIFQTDNVPVNFGTNPTLTLTASSTSVCSGNTSSLTVTGASSYTWNPGASTGTTVVVAPTATTIYTVTGINASGCSNTNTISLTVNSLPTLTATASSSAICVGFSASLTATGANSYTWNPGNSSGSSIIVTPTITTIYTVTGTNASGCSNTETVSLTVNTLPTAGITNSTGTTTLNCTTTSINLTATGGTTYSWTGGLGSSATATITNAGTYTVTATAANGCSSQSVITVSQNTTAPIVGITNSTGTTTLNCTTTSINVTATGGISYNWSGGLGSSATATITNPGTYTVTATGANGCSSQSVIAVTQNTTAPTAGITNSTGTTTLNCTTTSINVTATGGTSYTWSGGLGSLATATITNPGTYTVTATGANGCSSQSVITVSQNTTAPTAGITNSTGTTTLNCTTTSINVAATGGTSYSWTGGLGSSATATITNPGTYTVTATGSNGCSSQSVITVSQNTTAPIVGITNNAGTTELTCSTTSISLTATGANTYTWSGSLGSSNPATIISSGSYTLTGFGLNGCSSSTVLSITQATNVTVVGITNNTGTTELTCTTTSINFTATGGTSYTWTGGLGSLATATITNAGTYTVTATAANGCSSQSVITVSQNTTAPSVGITNSVGTTTLNCTTTSINVTATGGTSYSWTGGLGSLATATITNPGTYTVTATGSNGCSSQSVITVSQNTTAPILGITNSAGTTELTCSTNLINLTATGGTSYSWTGGLGSLATATITNPGTYTVTATGVNGCSSQSVITVSQNTTAPIVGITNSTGTTTLNCTTTSINVTATGGTSYSWTGGLGSLATATITNPGTYTVTATGSNGCSSQSVITVSQNTTAPIVGITNSTGTTTLNCTTTSINVTATGGTSYTWTGGLGSLATATITNPGLYTVTSTASNGCSSQSVITVSQNTAAPTTGITNSTGTTTLNCTTTSINVEATGGTSYSWTGGLGSLATATITNPGTYTVTATGVNGCSSQSVITVSQNTTAPTVGITNNTGTTEITCSTTSINLTATGANTYSWSSSLGSSNTVNIFSAGNYTLTGFGLNGCSSSTVLSITQATNVTVVGINNSTGTTELTCTTNSINVEANGGTSYTWSGGLGSLATATITNPGSYTVTATAANGCSSQSVITVSQNTTAPIVGITNSTGTTTLNCTTTSINLIATGGTSYTWSSGLGSSATATITNPGSYTITATEVNGCSSQSVIAVTQNTTVPTLTISSSSNSICEGGSIVLSGSGASGYTWNPGNLIVSTVTVSPTSTTVYTLNGLTGNGCSNTATVNLTINSIPVLTLSASSTTLCSNETTTLTAAGAATYSWNPVALTGSSITSTITSTIVYTVTGVSSEGCVGSSSITISLNNCPTAVNDATNTIENTPVSGNAGTNDSEIIGGTFTSGTPTAGTGTLTMDPATGQYTFTPSAGFTGVSSTSYTLCNGSPVVCSSAVITITVFPTLVANPDVIVTTPSVSTSGTLTTNDNGVVPGATYSVSVTQLPPSTGTITIDPATGQYTFTPNPTYTGSTTTTYTICNTSVNPIVCSSTTISILVGNLPTAVADATTTIENTPVSGDASTNDSGTLPSLNPVFTTGPVTAGTGTLTMDPATGQYTFTPSTGFTGTTSATYTLCNLSSPPCSTTTITFTVFPTLVANPDVIVTTPSVSTSGTLTTNDNGVVPGATYSVSVTQLPPSTGTITIDPATGQYTFTPNPTYTGSTTTTYTICNTSVNPIVCSSTTISILVGNLPTAVADATTTIENTPVSGDASTNDSGTLSTLNPVFTAGPVTAGTGTLTMDPATGQYTFTPSTGFTGTTSATYTLCNLSSPPCSTTTITFTVFPTLVANPDVIVTTPSVSTSGTLTTNDNGVVPGATYSVSVTQLPPSTGTITIDPATGQYTFTPNPTYTGSTTTTYTICNTSVNPIVCSSTTITIFVGGPQIAVAKTVLSTTKINATSFQTVYSFNVANIGNSVGSNVQLVDNLNSTFPLPMTYTVVGLNANSPLTVNSSYDGNSTIALLSGTNSLNPSQSSVVTLTVNFTPNTTTLTVINNSGVGSTSNLPDPTGNGTHTSSDTTHTGTNPDPDGDGNPNEPGENAPTTIGQQIGSAKAVTSLTKISANTYQTVFSFNVANTGPVVATNIQLVDNLNNTFPAPITYTVIGLNANSPLIANSGFNGNTDIALLSGNNSLNVNQNALVTLTVNFSPNTNTLTSLSNIGIVSTSNLPDPTGGGTHTSIDTTHAGNNPDPDGDGNPNEPGENDPVTFGQQIGVSKNALSTVKLENGDNQTTFVFTVQNLGVVSATNVQLVDNLNNTFPSPITYNVVSLTSSSGLNTNTLYDGGTDINLLTGTNTLTVGSIQTVTVVVKFNMNGSSLTSLYNYGVATSSSSNGTIISSDTTNAGNNPDTDDDGNPNEPADNIPTEFSPVNENPDEPEVFNIPQGFSPNGDGVNDVFVIRGISNYPNNKITILNRWGSVVFEKDNYDNTWDGKSMQGIRFGGDDLPDGTYFYLLDLGNGEKPYTGFIYISKTIK